MHLWFVSSKYQKNESVPKSPDRLEIPRLGEINGRRGR